MSTDYLGASHTTPIRLVNYINNHDIDIIHSHTVRSNVTAALCAPFTKAKFVSHAHSWARKELQGALKPRVNNIFNLGAYRAANNVIAVSEYLKQKITNSGISPQKVTVIKNGIDLESLPKLDKQGGGSYLLSQLEQLEEGKKGSETRFIASTALFRPIKGTIELVESFSSLLKEIPKTRRDNLYLLLIGEFINNSFKDEIYRRVNNLGIQNSVIFTGFRNDVLKLLTGVDLFVLPSMSEGLPYSLLEAGSLGLPIVATRVGGIDELIEDEVTGLLIEPGNQAEIAEAMEQLLYNDLLANQLGSSVQKRVTKNFNAQQLVANVSKLYKSLTPEI